MSFFRNLFAKAQVDRDLDEEVRAYIDLLVAEKIKAGMHPDDARRAARAEAGTPEYIMDEVRDVRRGATLETTLQDMRYGSRLLRRSPGFAAIAVLTIATRHRRKQRDLQRHQRASVLKPLPTIPAPDRLMFITSQFPQLNFYEFWISPPEYFELRGAHEVVHRTSRAYTTGAVNLSEGTRPSASTSHSSRANMFDVLGVRPRAAARVFTAEQDLPNAEPVVVLSHEVWQRSFGGDPAIVGKQIDINARKRTVARRHAAGFRHPRRARAALAAARPRSRRNRQNRGSHYLYLVGRLKPTA